MEPIRAQIHIPEDHRIHLEMTLPREIPTGPAEVTLLISSRSKPTNPTDLLAFAGCLANSALAQADSVAIQRRLRDEWD